MPTKIKRKLRADCIVRRSGDVEAPFIGFSIDLSSSGVFYLSNKLCTRKTLQEFLNQVACMGGTIRVILEEKIPQKKKEKKY